MILNILIFEVSRFVDKVDLGQKMEHHLQSEYNYQEIGRP